jgi:phosphoribosylformimino-5-aminoimidazole carboxamide ribotide isomerase
MDLYAAVDVLGGAAVRLTRGDFELRSDYGDPAELAARFAAEGAPWLHVVDLDGAKTGQPTNRPVIEQIVAAVDVPVQSGGGVRTADDVEALLAAGVSRVVLGTTAAEDPDAARSIVAAFAGRIALGLDYRRGEDGHLQVASRGWVAASGRTVPDLLAELADAGLAAVVATAIDRDGTLGGPDMAGLAAVLAVTAVPVIASGGVASADDVRDLAALRVPVSGSGSSDADGPNGDGGPNAPRRLLGVIAGRALVDGRLSVSEGVAACAPFG